MTLNRIFKDYESKLGCAKSEKADKDKIRNRLVSATTDKMVIRQNLNEITKNINQDPSEGKL